MSAKSISKKTNWLTVVNSMDPKEPTIIEVSGFIGDSWWDDSAKSQKAFCDELNRIPRGSPVVIRVNSEGGIIKDGLGIYNAVKNRKDDVTTEYIGYACSTASWAFSAASKVLAANNAVVMIHESSQGTWGNKRDHYQGGESLKTHDDVIAGMIAEKTGKSAAYVMKDMEAEKWMSGSEAVEYGIADALIEDAQNSVNTQAFNAPWMSRVPERFKNLAANSKEGTPQKSATANAECDPVT